MDFNLIWKLFRQLYSKKYKLKEIKAEIIAKETGLSIPTLFNAKDGNIEAFQSHSARSAWLYQPFESKGKNYVGIEYKGIGYQGKPIYALGDKAWGGVLLNEALKEHDFSKKAFEAGVFCQKPLMVYSHSKFEGKQLGIVVRTFVSPLRLSDFMFREKILKEYLNLRGQDLGGYTAYIAAILGTNVRKLFDAGLYHGSMEMNNITTEGEIADFEPTSGGTWEGVMENTEPRYQVLALQRIFNFVPKIFPNNFETFVDKFAHAFFNKPVKVSYKIPAKGIVEKYTGRQLKEKELEIEFPEIDKKKLLDLIEQAKKETKDADSLKRLDFVMDELVK